MADPTFSNATLVATGDPGLTGLAAAFSENQRDDGINAAAAEEISRLEALAKQLSDLASDPDLPEDVKREFSQQAATCMSAASNLRTSPSREMIDSAALLSAQIITKYKNAIDEDERELASTSKSDLLPSRSSILAATNSYMAYTAFAASRLQDEIDEKGAQAAVAENLMESDAAQYVWENREKIAQELGYQVDSEKYNQFMKNTLERAVAMARGELREDIFNELKEKNPELYAQYMRDHPGFNPFDRTQDDANYQGHYGDAVQNTLAQHSGWSTEDIKRIQDQVRQGYDASDKDKDFLLALKQDPNKAREVVDKYGAGLSKQELEDKIRAENPTISAEELQRKTDAYLTASITLDFHNSLNIEDTRLRETQLLADARERDIEERVRSGEITAAEGRRQKGELHETTMQRIDVIRNERLSPAEFQQEQERQRDQAVDPQSKIKLDTLSGDRDSNVDNSGRKRADIGLDPDMERALAEAGHIKQLIVKEVVLPANVSDEYRAVAEAVAPSQSQKGATPNDIFNLSKEMFAGIAGFQVANLNDGASVSPLGNVVAEGHQRAVGATKLFT